MGWTLIGWIIAIIWAFTDSNAQKTNVITVGASPSKYEELEVLAKLRDKGIVSEAEFLNKKEEILGRT